MKEEEVSEVDDKEKKTGKRLHEQEFHLASHEIRQAFHKWQHAGGDRVQC